LPIAVPESGRTIRNESLLESGIPLVDGVEHRFVTVGDVKIHYAEAGKGDALVLLHGFPQNWYMWRRQIPSLAKHFRVICPDMRGFGWSDAPRDGYEKEQLATDVVVLLDAIGIDRFKLMGHDWGGWLGFLIAMRHSQRVTRLLVLNVPHPYQRLDSRILSGWRLWYQDVLAAPWFGSLSIRKSPFLRFLMNLGVRHYKWSPIELEVYLGQLRDPARAMAGVLLYRTFLLREAMSLQSRYKSTRLTVPTLMLFGERDPFVSKALLKGYEPHADQFSIEFVPDCGHFIVEEQSALVTTRALEYFC